MLSLFKKKAPAPSGTKCPGCQKWSSEVQPIWSQSHHDREVWIRECPCSNRSAWIDGPFGLMIQLDSAEPSVHWDRLVALREGTLKHHFTDDDLVGLFWAAENEPTSEETIRNLRGVQAIRMALAC